MPFDRILPAQRLILRTISVHDLDDVHHLHSLPETDRYNTMGIPADRDATQACMQSWFDEMQQYKKYVFAIIDKKGRFIGITGMNIDRPRYAKAEIWYKIFPVYWGQGLATEVVHCLLSFGFEGLSLHRIEAGCATENVASARVLEKTGFILEGTSRKILPIRGEWKDGYNFGILKEDWLPGTTLI